MLIGGGGGMWKIIATNGLKAILAQCAKQVAASRRLAAIKSQEG
jgi:hypothetical protein